MALPGMALRDYAFTKRAKGMCLPGAPVLARRIRSGVFTQARGVVTMTRERPSALQSKQNNFDQ